MEQRELHVFLAVAETGSITKAAQSLGRSQPSVTRIIQDLEAELGFPLLQRVGRRIILSEEGVAFEEEARRLIASFAELAERAKAIAAGKGRMLEIASTAAIAHGLLPQALAGIEPKGLPPEVRVVQYAPSAVTQEVRSGRAEIGFAALPLETPGLHVLRLYAAPSVAALAETDPLAEEDVVDIRAFSGRRMVTMLSPFRFQRHVIHAFRSLGVEPGSVVRTNTTTAALQMAQALKAPAIIDPVTAYGMKVPGIVIRPLSMELSFVWGVLGSPVRPLRPLAELVIEHAEDVARKNVVGMKVLDPALATKLDDFADLSEAAATPLNTHAEGTVHE